MFQARTADRNLRAMAGAALLGKALAKRLGQQPTLIGQSQPPLNADWQTELEAAQSDLKILAQTSARVLSGNGKPLIAMGRCASALATLPVVARHRPDALVVWFDAHADAHTPATTTSGYLGGMVLSAAAGLWNSGLGSGLPLSNIVLVGARAIDPAEQVLIDAGTLLNVPLGKDLSARLRAAIGNRPVYIHIDCDVLQPGIVPTEYRVPGGLSLDDLRACCERLAENEIVGVEIAEFEAAWAENGQVATPDDLLAALQPLFDGVPRNGR
ncbi:MAG: arginase family protein [Burkholderiaceae bacterium]|nr:arginase family protein [Burkholderiaceae bacterium]